MMNRESESSPVVYIYALAEPDTLVVRYVGKATNLSRRMVNHRNEKGTTRKVRWLARLRQQGLSPIMKILACVSAERDVWQAAETRWIAHYRALGCDLVNLTDGGEGLHNSSSETRAKIAARQRELFADPLYRAKFLEIARSSHRRLRISQALTGRAHSVEHVSRLPQNRPGRKLTLQHRMMIAQGLQGNQNALGLKHTAETRGKIADALRGNKHTLGRQMPEAEKRQRSESLRGRPKSEEHRARIRQGQLEAWARRRGQDGQVQVLPEVDRTDTAPSK